MIYACAPLLRRNRLFDLRGIDSDSKFEKIETAIAQSLKERIESDVSYDVDEIESITKRSHSLFPADYRLDSETAKYMRALSALSQAELRPSRAIRSHRKFIGPLVVFLKRATWPLVKFHLTDSFKGIEEFQSWAVTAIGQLVVKNRALEDEIKELRRSDCCRPREQNSC